MSVANPDDQNDAVLENDDQIDAQVTDDQQNDDADDNQPVAPAARTAPREELSPRDRALMNKARAEEKQKLYQEKQKDKTRIAELERQLKDRQSTVQNTETNSNSNDSGLLAEVRSLREEIAQTRREGELREYRARRIDEIRRSGSDVIEGIAVGNSVEELELNIDIAQAEFEVAREKILAGQPRANTNTVIREARQRPSGVPRSPKQPSQVSDAQDELSVQEVRNIIGPGGKGIRDGSYAQNREKILRQLQSGRGFRTA